MKIDGKKLEELMKKNCLSQTAFANSVGVAQCNISMMINGKETPSVQTLNSICFTLGCKKEDIMLVEQPTGASAIIQDGMTSEKIEELSKEINSLRIDLQNMAKMLIQINKTCNENKAQGELNAEELKAIFNKVTDCSSSINKVSGKIKGRVY